MVRTLDFHSKNVGSNPAGPNYMITLVPHYITDPIKHGSKVSTSYVSLINPFILSNYSFENYKRFATLKPNQKVYVKQSYMILTWFYYLNFVFKTKTKKKITGLRFAMAPKIRRKFTITKAPIAHKTRSKEQILFTFFKFKMTVNVYNFSKINNFEFYTNSDQALLSIILTKKTLALSETNLLFLQKKKTFLSFIDPFFFAYKM